jgi:hypothetical protein
MTTFGIRIHRIHRAARCAVMAVFVGAMLYAVADRYGDAGLRKAILFSGLSLC